MPHSYAVSFARVRLPRLPTRILTSSAETANSATTIICRSTGKYSRSIRKFGVKPLRRKTGLLHADQMAILLCNRLSQSRGQTLVFLAILFDRTPSHEVLQFLVGSQTQHFLAAAGSISGPKILVHDVEQLLKLKRRTPREDSNQLLSYQIRNPTGECIFL